MSVEMHGEDLSHHERMHALQTCLRTPHSNLTRNEVNFLIARLFTVSRSEQGTYSSSSQFGESIYRDDRGEADKHPLQAHDSSEIRDLIRVKAASLRVARGRHGYNAHEKEKAHEKVSSSTAGRERRPTVHSKHTSNSHEVHRRTHYLPARTAQEITDAVFECRKQSIMRGILNNISDSAAATLLLKSLEHAKYTLVLEGKMQSSSIYLPVKTCFEILQESAPLRLTRGQIMVIIAWTDCFDPNNTAIDYKRFAAYAASMVKKLQDADYQEKRSRILHMLSKVGQNSDRSGDEADGDRGGGNRGFAKHNDFALNGLTEADLHNYFEREFSAVQNRSTSTVSKEEFIEVLKRTPSLKLSETDCVTLYSAFPNDVDGCVHWKEFVPWSYESISQLCMERLVQRRITLLSLEGHNDRRHTRPRNQYLSKPNSKSASRIGTPLDEEGGARSGPFLSTTSEEEEIPSIASSVSMAHQSMDALGNLASKLVDLLKVHSYSLTDTDPPPGANTILGEGDKLGSVCVCFLPVDEVAYEVTHEHQSEHAQEDDELSLESLSNEQSEGGSSALLEIFIDVPCKVIPEPQKSPQLLRGQIGGSFKASPSSMKIDPEKNNPSRKTSTTTAISLLPCTVRMLAVDKPMSLDRELHVSVEYVNVTNAMGEQTSFVASLAQPVQLPSMCLVDSHAAVNYAKTLVDRISLEITANNAQPPVLSLRANESAFFGHSMDNW